MKTKGSFIGFHTTPDELLSVLKKINRDFEDNPDSIPDLRQTTLTEIIAENMRERKSRSKGGINVNLERSIH